MYLPKLLSVVNSSVSHDAPAEGAQTWVGTGVRVRGGLSWTAQIKGPMEGAGASKRGAGRGELGLRGHGERARYGSVFAQLPIEPLKSK